MLLLRNPTHDRISAHLIRQRRHPILWTWLTRDHRQLDAADEHSQGGGAVLFSGVRVYRHGGWWVIGFQRDALHAASALD